MIFIFQQFEQTFGEVFLEKTVKKLSFFIILVQQNHYFVELKFPSKNFINRICVFCE